MNVSSLQQFSVHTKSVITMVIRRERIKTDGTLASFVPPASRFNEIIRALRETRKVSDNRIIKVQVIKKENHK